MNNSPVLGRTEMRTPERKEYCQYQQFDLSPDTIKQELIYVDCEQRQTFSFKDNVDFRISSLQSIYF